LYEKVEGNAKVTVIEIPKTVILASPVSQGELIRIIPRAVVSKESNAYYTLQVDSKGRAEFIKIKDLLKQNLLEPLKIIAYLLLALFVLLRMRYQNLSIEKSSAISVAIFLITSAIL